MRHSVAGRGGGSGASSLARSATRYGPPAVGTLASTGWVKGRAIRLLFRQS